jgi:hypothetical protein
MTNPFDIVQKAGDYLIVRSSRGDFAVLGGDVQVVKRDIERLDEAFAFVQSLYDNVDELISDDSAGDDVLPEGDVVLADEDDE